MYTIALEVYWGTLTSEGDLGNAINFEHLFSEIIEYIYIYIYIYAKTFRQHNTRFGSPMRHLLLIFRSKFTIDTSSKYLSDFGS